MSTRANTTFEVTRWEETPVNEFPGEPRNTRATIVETIAGDFEGTATSEYLLSYRLDGTAEFVGVKRLNGHLGRRVGGFLLHGSGSFAKGMAKGTWRIIEGSGSGEMRGIKGQGSFQAEEGPKGSLTFDYDFS